MKQKILLSDYMFSCYSLLPKGYLSNLNKKYDVLITDLKRKMTRREILTWAEDCVGIVAGSETYDEKVLNGLPKLRCISRTGAGIDGIDLDEARKHGVVVKNTPLAPTQAVAELTIGLMIALLRKIPDVNSKMHKRKWDQIHGGLLNGRTVGIVGVGNIGKRVTLLLKPFKCKVLGNDIDPDMGWFKKNKIKHVEKKELFAKSDVVTLHPSLLPGNKHMINKKAFDQMKNGVIILNLSRGQIIKEEDLIGSLKEGRVAAAALDVFEKEPYKGPLQKMNKVILTPHVGACTNESRKLMQIQAIKNLLTALNN